MYQIRHPDVYFSINMNPATLQFPKFLTLGSSMLNTTTTPKMAHPNVHLARHTDIPTFKCYVLQNISTPNLNLSGANVETSRWRSFRDYKMCNMIVMSAVANNKLFSSSTLTGRALFAHQITFKLRKIWCNFTRKLKNFNLTI